MRRRLTAIASLFAITLLTDTARAEWGTPGVVDQIQHNRNSYEDGDIFIFLKGTGCSSTNPHFRVKRDQTSAEDRDAMLSLLIASKLSERPVRLGFSRTSGTCSVYAVKF